MIHRLICACVLACCMAIVTFLSLLTPSNTSAQADCSFLTVKNESLTMPLDEAQICEAARPLAQNGLQVYVYLTDFLGADEGDWFDHIDEVDFQWGLQMRSNPGKFSRTAIAFEASTNASRPWGHNVSFGSLLMQTPLDADGPVGKIKGTMKNEIAAGNATQAFVQALTMVNDYAYLQPQRDRIARETQAVENRHARATENAAWSNFQATAAVQNLRIRGTVSARETEAYTRAHPTAVPKTPAQLKAEAEARQQALNKALGLLIGLMLLLAALYGLARALSYLYYFARMKRHANRVYDRIGDVLLLAYDIVSDEKGGTLFKVWYALDGARQPQHEDVLAHLVHARSGVARAMSEWRALERADFPFRHEAIRVRVILLETILVTLTGRDPAVLGMTGQQLIDLLNPLRVIKPTRFGGLNDQIQEAVAAAESRGPDSLRIKLLYVDVTTFDELGVLGRVLRVKQALGLVQEAMDEVPGRLKQADAAIAEMAENAVDVGGFLPPEVQLAFLRGLLRTADNFAQQNRWIQAQAILDELSVALASIPDALGHIKGLVAAVEAQLAEVREIEERGYQLGKPHKDILVEMEADREAIRAAFESGDWPAAGEAAAELERDAKRMLEMARAIVALHAANTQRLQELSREVAAAMQEHDGMVSTAWDKLLHGYPSSCWHDIRNNRGWAQETLKSLFDDPNNENDLASRIALLNSLEHQMFKTAASELAEAFSRLHEARQLMQAITARLQQVEQIESTIEGAIADVRTAHSAVAARRDADDNMITPEVDRLLTSALTHIDQASRAASDRHLLQAAELLNVARQAVAEAESQVTKQITRIKGLLAQLEGLRTQVGAGLATANDLHNGLPHAGRSDASRRLLEAAQAASERAQRLDSTVRGEDDALAKALEEAIVAFRQAVAAAFEAQQQIRADDEAYMKAIKVAVNAIEAAERAIESAAMRVAHADAYGAGQTALEKARKLLPNKPTRGVTAEFIRRASSDAKAAKEAADQALAAANQRIAEEEQKRQDEQDRRDKLMRDMLASSARSTTRSPSVTVGSRYSSPSPSHRSSNYGSMSRSSSHGPMSRR